tara:strand:+ start:162 stop:893 length:732 start_codon:yes stop_codon:yes gene_type:complete
MLKLLLSLPILRRLIPSVLKKLPHKEINYKYDNINFNLDLRYLVDRRFFLYGYDVKNIEILNRYIQKYEMSYFLDIGSCWGLYSLQIANNNSKIKVLSFDVFQQNIDRIKKMSLQNNFQNIETYNIAVGSEDSEVEFSVNEEFSPNYSKDLNGKFKIKVEQKKIDTLLGIRDQRIAIKIDVERSEMDVLKGSKELLKGNSCLIQLECENKNQKEVLEFFSKIEYVKLNLKGDNDDLYFTNFKS